MPFEKMNFYIKYRAIKGGDRPYIPEFVPEHWCNLLNQCWAQDPNKRPTFTEICDMLETDDFVNNLSARGAFDEYKKQMESFRPSSKKSDKSKDNIFIGEDNQKFYKKIDDIGEGRRSIAYKIIDTRTNEILCKKVVKIQDDSTSFKNIKNAIKEFEVLHSIKHPCICSAIAINPAEPFSNVTTVSLYLEFIPRKLKDCLANNILDNTLKTRVVIEIVHAMKFIHQKGLIHRDLRIENIMLNSVFETKLVDFGFVKIDENINGGISVMSSLNSDANAMIYMSPQLINDEDYDSKTDVYSFGMVLHYIFIGQLPNYSLRDIHLKKKIPLPRSSSLISQFCIDLIAKCTKYEPAERPSFDKILESIRENSYLLAPEVDRSLISRRDNEPSSFDSNK